ncbi:U3 snoRNP protein [Toensbergia leucococca]|nr:U3 snoRNP protein [Toensbergia leucococca]
MAAPPSGRTDRPPRKVKGGTVSTKKYRFESFNQRITKIKIDPIRRARRSDIDHGDLTETTSFFKTGLEQWKDLNLSENFTSFVQEVEPLCDSLPQIVHYHQGIMDILINYIGKRDQLSLEPLLILLGHFAHDLGVRFEGHFSISVSLVVSLAAKHSDVQVIEWSFTCLAWLFKYLSRLLVPDLRPLYDIMAPLLGRELQKIHTTRFAAEAMSFLVRKAALAYHKNQAPLTNIVQYMLADLESMVTQGKNTQVYQHGLMTLLADSIKGVGRGIQSCGTVVYRCLLDLVLEREDTKQTQSLDVVFGVTISLIHHTDADAFQPILEIILQHVNGLLIGSNNSKIAICGRLLFIATAVRKGSRIQDWQPVLGSLLFLLAVCKENDNESATQTYKAAAVILQASPLNVVIPTFRLAMDIIADIRTVNQFLPFCNYFYELGHERFHDLLSPFLSTYVVHLARLNIMAKLNHRFITSHWSEYEMQLLVLIPKIFGNDQRTKCVCPKAWQEHIIDTFERARIQETLVSHCSAYLEVIQFFAVAPPFIERIMQILGAMVRVNLQAPSWNSLSTQFGLGVGLKVYIKYSSHLESTKLEMWSQLCTHAKSLGCLPVYLEAVLAYIQVAGFDETSCINDLLIDVMVENLHSSSHVLRKLSLQIIDTLYTKRHDHRAESIATALLIEDTPLDLQSARSASMYIRKLPLQYKVALSDEWLNKAIPHFCFGLLTFKLSQFWEDAIAALKDISCTKEGEDLVSHLAFQWLDEPNPAIVDENTTEAKNENSGPLSNFQCSNLIELENFANQNLLEMESAAEQIDSTFKANHTSVSSGTSGAPSRALRVLLGLPYIAEKRSRRLVPIFLRWAANEETEVSVDAPEVAEDSSLENSVPNQTTMGRKDRKTMLEIFSSFSNPRVLYRASDVFNALLFLLTNGDVEVQKSVLKAIFTWKKQSIQLYQDNLMNLLDDARFREEIAVFVNINDQDSAIQSDHREELMPVLLRLLYGKIIAKAGVASGRKGQLAKRKAVLQALSRFEEKDLSEFLKVALGPLDNLRLVHESQLVDGVLLEDRLSTRKQLGLINMMKEVLEILGDQVAFLAHKFINALLYCMVKASRALSSSAVADPSQDSVGVSQISMLKTIRQVGIQCLTLLSRTCAAQDLRPYLPAVFTEIISPRLINLAIDTAQSVSGLLHLFSTWASSPEMATFLADFDSSVIGMVVDCLDVPSAKDEVKLFVIEEILKQIVVLAMPLDSMDENQIVSLDNMTRQLLHPNMDTILNRVGALLRKSPSKELLSSAIQFVSMLAPVVVGSSQIENLLEVSTFLLDQPSHRVSPKSKGDILKIIQHFVPLYDLHRSADLQERIFNTVSSLFGYFRDRANRVILSQVLSILANNDPELLEVAKLCVSLNSFSSRKLDEPDFDSRLRAFSAINESRFRDFTPKQWRPIMYNMLFYVRDNEELAIRSNASFTLRRFVETNVIPTSISDIPSFDLIKLVLLPALRNGTSEPSELVRAEYLAIMAHLIRHNPQWSEISDMSVLLVDDDEEASFFANILHIQQHRRLRALRRLAAEGCQGCLRSVNVAHFFIPLIEQFIFNKADDESAHNLSAEAVLTIGALTASIEWPQFRAMFRRYNGYILSKTDLEKTTIKLLGVVIDAFSQAAAIKEEAVQQSSQSTLDENSGSGLPAHVFRNALARTIPKQEKLTEDLSNNLVPPLMSYLHNKDESTVSLRVPVAISIVKLLKLLPSDRLKERLPPVLTDVCHILRSRAQESRDMTRKTLVEISTLIGPSYFGFVLKELRSSLARGYQLHVLSFTVHAILVATASIFKPGDLDYCLQQIVAIIMDDIFGATGQEKDAEEYISKMREVKSSKSYDSMELVAKTATVDHLAQLIRPLQVMLEEKLDFRLVKKIDELLRRIGVGVLRNEGIQDRRILIFCHEVISEVYRRGGTSGDKKTKQDYRTKRFLVTLSASSKYGKRGSTSSYNYKLARFALDILRSVLHKHDTLQTPANISGFLPIIGDAVVQSQEEVQISALRLLTAIIKVPLRDIDENAGIYVAECVKIIKASISTNTELAQAALKLISAVLRERRQVEIKETDLAYLLKRLKPDLEEPDRQGVTFNFLKAIMARKVVITEVYEVLDTVAAIMITNQTRGARDLARGLYFQFIMDYPQSKERFSKQLGFLVKNLDYKHREGRQSIMEVIHLLLSKVSEDLVQDIIGTFFVPLVMVVVNDESLECREMAGTLLKESFERADKARTQSFLTLIRTWLSQIDQPLLIRVALQLYNLYIDSHGAKADKEISSLQARLTQILKTNLQDIATGDWELLYFTLQLFSRICQVFPATLFAAGSEALWTCIRKCLSFPHAWVKLSTANLIGLYFADFARTNANIESPKLPLPGSGGLWLGRVEIAQVTRVSLRSLKVPGIGEELATQTVRNMVFLGRMMGTTSMTWPQAQQHPGAEVAEDDEDADEEVVSGDEISNTNEKPAVLFVFERASVTIRRGPLTTRAAALVPMKAALQLIGSLCTHLSISTLKSCIETILLPLNNMTDPTIAPPFSTDEDFNTNYKTLVSNGQEIMSLLQKKLGTTEYIAGLTRVKKGVKEKREGRRIKRRIEAVAEPEKTGLHKKRKGEKKREKRKERSGEERGRRRGW